jgi:putative spermidine/putrescine transport system permease protein
MTSVAAAAGGGRMRRWSRVLPTSPLLIFLALAFVYPVAQLLWLSFWTKQGDATFAHYVRFFTSPVYLQVLLITVKIAFFTTVLCIIAGYPVAYLLSTVAPNRRNTLILWILMPFWTSFLVRTFAWVVLLGRNGVINASLKSMGMIDDSLDLIYNFAGVMVGTSHALLPMAVLTMLGPMQTIDPSLTKAAGTLGARGGQTFWRVYFPLSAPGVAASGLLIFTVAMGFFITPMLLGSRKESMIAQLIMFQVDEMLNWNFAGAISVVLLVITFAFFFLYDRIVGITALAGERAAPSDGRGAWLRRAGAWFAAHALARLGDASAAIAQGWERITRRESRSGGATSRAWLWTVSLLLIAFLVVPSFFLIPVSFTSGDFIEWPPRGFSLQWYREYFESPVWRAATARSLLVGVATAALSLVLGVPAAFVLSRQRLFARSAILAFIVSPLILPHIVVAIGLFYVYARIGLVGTSLGLILGHTVFAVPYVVITMMAALKNYDHRLDQAAATLGANTWQTLRRVTLPVLRAGVFASFVFAFVRSFDELTVAMFVSTGVATTLPKQMWSDALLKINPTLAAVSTCLLVFITLTILLTEYLGRRRR